MEHESIKEYRELIKKYNVKIDTDAGNIMCFCPFHDDEKASLSINKATGLFNCFAKSCKVKDIKNGGKRNVEFFKSLLENKDELFH